MQFLLTLLPVKKPEAVKQSQACYNYIYHVAFDAKATIKNQVITRNKAIIEADFKGRHIGEFAGIPPTNKEVNVPLCVSYDIEDGLIKTARIYMLASLLVQQLQG